MTPFQLAQEAARLRPADGDLADTLGWVYISARRTRPTMRCACCRMLSKKILLSRFIGIISHPRW